MTQGNNFGKELKNFIMIESIYKIKYIALFTGDRQYIHRNVVFELLEQLKYSVGKHLIALHGGCRGADTLVDECCEDLGIQRIVVPANWVGYGQVAGIMRNEFMLHFFEPNIVYAFHDNLNRSKGTRHTYNLAVKMGIRAIHVDMKQRVELEESYAKKTPQSQ